MLTTDRIYTTTQESPKSLVMLSFIVGQEPFIFPENKGQTIEDQVDTYIDMLQRELFPEHVNVYKSKIKENCWHLFKDFLTISEISNATGLTYHGVRNRIQGVKYYKRLRAAMTNDLPEIGKSQYLISFRDFIEYDFDHSFKGKSAHRKRYPLLLQGKETLIQEYFNDSLPIVQIAKALGVSRNTLLSFISKKMPEFHEKILETRRIKKMAQGDKNGK